MIVKTRCGMVKGTADGGVCAWRGIPYAQAPGRFMPPRPAQPWKDVRSAEEYGASCPQENEKNGVMAEECLFLNIWSPAADGAKRPVMFFIHGGSFAGGSGSEEAYNGANLAGNEDVVVVTVNYRVGILGFLDFSFLEDGFYANCGLYDILEALRWVKENIAFFGGDPENVTAFGQSAGGTAASVLPTLPAARGLFSKCIVMSGGPTLLQSAEEGQRTARAFLKLMNIKDADGLRRIPEGELPAMQREFTARCGLGVGTFRISAGGSLVPEYPIAAARAGMAKGIPLLMGTTREEMSFLAVKPLARAWGLDGIMGAGVSHESEECRECIPNAYHELYGKKRGKALMYSDMIFRMGNVWYAQEYNAHADVWLYRFDYETAAMRVSGLHAFHSSDIPFLFGNFRAGIGKLIFLLSPSKREARELSREMQRDFAAFARTGRADWERCTGTDIPAKHYAKNRRIAPAVDERIRAQYEKTHFRKTSFESCKEN